MTPEQEATYALDWDLPRADLDPAVRREYDRLKMEREAQPPVPDAAEPQTETETRLWPFLIAGFVVAVAWITWAVFGVAITGSHMNFRTLSSDAGRIRLPHGYEKVSTSESGSDCAHQLCVLKEFWIWHGSGARTAANGCRDIMRAMGANYSNVESNDPIPRGAACEYFTTLDSFLHPGLGKRIAVAFVWVNEQAKGSPGGYEVELLDSYNYAGE
jgi:hypothetical protein